MRAAGLAERERHRQQARGAGSDEHGFCSRARGVLGARDPRRRLRVGLRDGNPHPGYEYERGDIRRAQCRDRPGGSLANRKTSRREAADGPNNARASPPARSGRLGRSVRLVGALRCRYVRAPVGQYPRNNRLGKVTRWPPQSGIPHPTGAARCAQRLFAVGASRPRISIPELHEHDRRVDMRQSRCNVPDFYSRAEVSVEDRGVSLERRCD